MMFKVNIRNRVTGGQELVIEPIFKDFYNTIDRIRIPYTKDIKIIKENIAKFFDERIEDIILV